MICCRSAHRDLGRHQRADDGAGRGAGDAVELVAVLLQDGDGTDQADALHASTLEHEISRCHGSSARIRGLRLAAPK